MGVLYFDWWMVLGCENGVASQAGCRREVVNCNGTTDSRRIGPVLDNRLGC